MKLIIITGAPATGKSSIAQNVSQKTGIPSFSKDEFKIELFEKYGFNDHDEKKKLSIQGEKMLIDTIKKYVDEGKDIIIDNNFKDFNAVREAISRNSCCVICVLLKADHYVLAKRYNDRISSGNRHTALYTLNKYPVVKEESIFHPLLNEKDVDDIQKNVKEITFGDNVIEFDTTDIENSYEKICSDIVRYIKSFK